MEHTQESLIRMSETHDYDVADHDLDVRGWTVTTSENQEVGRVDDLVIDPTGMKVRYLEVALSDQAAAEQSGGVLVPIEAADLERSRKTVVIHGLGAQQFRALPRYGSAAAVSPSTASYARKPVAEDDTRRLTRAEEELRIGKRMVQAGEVRVGKHVESEHVRTPVTLAKERVTVERRPVTAETTGEVRIGDSGEIVVPIMEEEAVIEKRAVVKEELVIEKERVSETETVEAEVRKEQFDIEGAGERVRSRGER